MLGPGQLEEFVIEAVRQAMTALRRGNTEKVNVGLVRLGRRAEADQKTGQGVIAFGHETGAVKMVEK